MNNNEFYQRHDDRALPEPSSPQPRADADGDLDVDALAVHRDPSVQEMTAGSGPQAVPPGVAWVRPSEMPTLVGSGWVRRGIDLQSELVRRSRRSPVTASRAVRRARRSGIARTEPGAPTATDGIEL